MTSGNKYRLTFYMLWFVLAIAQAASTQLIDDEAYYWVYSKFPALGYFDHPPMTAWLIKPGYALFSSELGVRLLMVILNVLTVMLIEKMLPVKNNALFFLIAGSIAVIQLGGFMAVPDTPLLFFTALFFFAYKNFLSVPNARYALLLGVVMALLFYTKYHGLLVVLFTVLSNLRLLKNKYAWLAFFVTVTFYVPHLYWQWQHDWISFKYHLFESNVSPYHIKNTLEYIGGQILLCGPLIGFLLLPAAIFYKTTDKFERALKFTMLGIYILFLISSFRGKVEMNWPMPALIPLIILSHTYISHHPGWIRPARIVAAVSIMLILTGRIYMIEDIGPDNSIKKRLHYSKEWVQALHSRTGELPVVFYNSYQRASVYWFYSGVRSHSMNAITERVNSYSFWRTNHNLISAVYFADIYDMHKFTDSIKTRKWTIGFKKESMYFPLEDIKFVPVRNKVVVINDTISISGKFVSQTGIGRYVEEMRAFKFPVYLDVFDGKELKASFKVHDDMKDLLGHTILLQAHVGTLKKGSYDIIIGIATKDYFPIHNSSRLELMMK